MILPDFARNQSRTEDNPDMLQKYRCRPIKALTDEENQHLKDNLRLSVPERIVKCCEISDALLEIKKVVSGAVTHHVGGK